MDYQKIANKMSEFLRENKNDWQERYGEYICALSEHRDYISEVEKTIQCKFPLKVYLPLSSAKIIKDNKDINFQIRYKGNLVGELKANKNESKFYITDNHANNSSFKFKDVDKYKKLNNMTWNKSLQKELFSCLDENVNTAPEHQFESFLLNNLAEARGKNKIIPYITPVTWGGGNDGSCFQMPTTWKGSLLSKKDFKEEDVCSNMESFWAESNAEGGGIDILARRMYGTQVSLAIMELKSPNGKFKADRVVLQALAYTVFIRELLRSENTNNKLWWKMFINYGSSSLDKPLKLEAVVVLSQLDQELEKPNFSNQVINIGDDEISLHYLYLTRKDLYSWELEDNNEDTSLNIMRKENDKN